MNIQHSLIQELILNEVELSDNTAEANKNISYAKCEGAVDSSTITRGVKKFHTGAKNFDN